MLESIVYYIQDTLNDCAARDFACSDSTDSVPESPSSGTLPVPTRCWSTYLTFFGDNQQLQCTAADTCRAQGAQGLSPSEYIVCGMCPQLDNPNVRDFGCDWVTKLCSCAVPILGTSHCSTNEDCSHTGVDTSCKLIKDDLSLSKTSSGSLPSGC